MEEKLEFRYDVDESPSSKLEFIILSIQHVFAMFGSTILVPTLIGIDVSVALVTAGIGTIIYTTVTRKKVPVFIGSSFAYIAVLTTLLQEGGNNLVAIGVCIVGLLYILFSVIIHLVGTKWIDAILPPVVIGPLIIIIGLSLAGSAVINSGLTPKSEFYSIPNIAISLISLIGAVLSLLIGSKTMKVIPIIMGIFSGYLAAIILNLFTAEKLIDISPIYENGLFTLPDFNTVNLLTNFDIAGSDILFAFTAVLPLVIVTVSEHIGDHTVSSSILNRNFLHDPGLGKTILGDGLATFVAGIIGGPVNTTYAENTGVIMLTRVASVSIIRAAAVFAIVMAFLSPVVGFISSIPTPVLGGISILLFGMIAQNGIRILITANVDISHPRNLLLMAIILVLGLGGGVIAFSVGSFNFEFVGTSLAALAGVILHLSLPFKEIAYGKNHDHLKS